MPWASGPEKDYCVLSLYIARIDDFSPQSQRKSNKIWSFIYYSFFNFVAAPKKKSKKLN